jgi:hypothetical protein
MTVVVEKVNVAVAAEAAAKARISVCRRVNRENLLAEIFLRKYIDKLLYKSRQLKSTNIEGQNGHLFSSTIYLQQSHRDILA